MFVSLLVPSIYDANTSYPVPPTGRMNHRRRPLTSTLPPYSRQLPPFLLEVTPITLWFGSRDITTSSGRQSLPAGHLGSQELAAFLPTKGAPGTPQEQPQEGPKGLTCAVTPAPSPP